MKPHHFFILILFLGITHCGGSTSSSTTPSTDSTSDNSVNTTKLINTPFEGLTTGDDFNTDLFMCGKYRTETIDSFPIKIFAAFFTTSEEAIIQDGIVVANAGVGFEAYQLTDTWADDVRVIYKMDLIVSPSTGQDNGAAGFTNSIIFNYNGKFAAEIEAPDWIIELETSPYPLDKWIVAHELGHASGIQSHALIDYVNDTITSLEADSLMASDAGSSASGDPALTDYDFMMSMQGQIIEDHLGEAGDQISGPSETTCETEGLNN